jgi:hypothetical protein
MLQEIVKEHKWQCEGNAPILENTHAARSRVHLNKLSGSTNEAGFFFCEASVFIFSRRIRVHGNAYRSLHFRYRIVLYS